MRSLVACSLVALGCTAPTSQTTRASAGEGPLADVLPCYDELGDLDGDGEGGVGDCIWAALCPGPASELADVDGDGDVDLDDCRELLRGGGGPHPRGTRAHTGRTGYLDQADRRALTGSRGRRA